MRMRMRGVHRRVRVGSMRRSIARACACARACAIAKRSTPAEKLPGVGRTAFGQHPGSARTAAEKHRAAAPKSAPHSVLRGSEKTVDSVPRERQYKATRLFEGD
ncbi:hypothetical protein [Burkholderia savannae]|uniref:hypothetical protein n=1 Tax=Burkholderia savannae TaxID=1637837 RepID=UPI000A77AAF3|nr:hypothetical protein [Burkholderia savannae]